MKNPCRECSKWATEKFPECRMKCEDNEKYLLTFKVGAAMGEYTHIPYQIHIPNFKITS